MKFKASNGKTYEVSVMKDEPNRILLKIIKGGSIFLPNLDGARNGQWSAIAPYFDPQTGIMNWDNDMYSSEDIDAFVPPDLKELCERIAKNLVLV